MNPEKQPLAGNTLPVPNLASELEPARLNNWTDVSIGDLIIFSFKIAIAGIPLAIAIFLLAGMLGAFSGPRP